LEDLATQLAFEMLDLGERQARPFSSDWPTRTSRCPCSTRNPGCRTLSPPHTASEPARNQRGRDRGIGWVTGGKCRWWTTA